MVHIQHALAPSAASEVVTRTPADSLSCCSRPEPGSARNLACHLISGVSAIPESVWRQVQRSTAWGRGRQSAWWPSIGGAHAHSLCADHEQSIIFIVCF